MKQNRVISTALLFCFSEPLVLPMKRKDRSKRAEADRKHNTHSRHSSAESSRDSALLTTVGTTASTAKGTMATTMVAFLTTISAPILVVATRFAWAVPGLLTGITASSTAAIGSDIMSDGHQAGATTTTFMSTMLGAPITCTIRGTPAFALRSTCSNDLATSPSGEDLLDCYCLGIARVG